MDKFEYLTGEDLGLKRSTVDQARFEYSPLGKNFIKGLSEDDKEEGLFKRLQNIENAPKNLIRNDDKDKKQQTNNIDTKPSNIFNYLKSLIPKASDLMDEIEEDYDINNDNLLFIGSNKKKKKINFNTFKMPLDFLQDIYNEKSSLKKAEFK